MKQVPKYIREVARELRNNMTDAEIKLWARIKNEQIGVKFLRQKPLYMFTEDSGGERYIIADFYCSEMQVVIEIDGGVHNNTEILLLDKHKEELLDHQGIKVIRITNQEILGNTDACIDNLQQKISQLSLGKREYPEGGRDYYPRNEKEGGDIEGGSHQEGTVITRCTWANPNNELYIKYHDEEWGKPVYDDTILFEFLILEGAQAGLSWETILKKRENYRVAFDSFDYEKIAKYNQKKIDELLGNVGIVRNKLKINSAIKNAKVFIEIRKEFGSFSNYLWSYVENKQIINSPKNMSEVPVSTELSDTISKDLKQRGMNFIGTTIMYAYLQAVGVVNDHIKDCSHRNI